MINRSGISPQDFNNYNRNLYNLTRVDHSLQEEARARREEILAQAAAIDDQLNHLPQGDFSCRANGGRFKWYRIQDTYDEDSTSSGSAVEDSGTEEAESASGNASERPHLRHRRTYEYIPHSNELLARQLALRKYLLSLETDLRCELRAIEVLLNSFDRKCYHANQFRAAAGIAPLLDPQIEEGRAQIAQWRNAPYEMSDYRPEDRSIPTIGGFNVRSKSEALIANLLIERDIPFRYECVQLIGQKTYAPDFTILHPVTLREVIWEHFGMMDSANYQSEYWSKMGKYLNNGYYPYVNLITTFETRTDPLNVHKANRIVKMMFDR